CGRAVLEHFHSSKQGARIEILIAHISKRGAVVGAPNLQGLARHHPPHEIRRRVAVSVHHARHRDSLLALDGAVERTRRCPFSGSHIRQRVTVDNDRTALDYVVLSVHRDDESVTNQSLHGAPRQYELNSNRRETSSYTQF